MTIEPRTEHHAEVIAPEVWATAYAGKLADIGIELPDHMIMLTPEEATHLRDELSAMLARYP